VTWLPHSQATRQRGHRSGPASEPRHSARSCLADPIAAWQYAAILASGHEINLNHEIFKKKLYNQHITQQPPLPLQPSTPGFFRVCVMACLSELA
jgi:hypothetical protein